MDIIYAWLFCFVSMVIYAPLSKIIFKEKTFSLIWNEFWERLTGVTIGLVTYYLVSVMS